MKTKRDDGVSCEVVESDCVEYMKSVPDGTFGAVVTDPPYGLSFMNKKWDSFGSDTRQPGDEHYVIPDNLFGRSKVRYGYGSRYNESMSVYQERMTDVFSEALRVAKPGAPLFCFGGSKTHHRLACAIEDAGWNVVKVLMWTYGSGFPKSMDVSKAIDKALGAERPVVGHSDHGSGPWHGKLANHCKGDTGIGIFDGSGKSFDITGPASDQARQWDGWGTCLKPAWEAVIVGVKPGAEPLLAEGSLDDYAFYCAKASKKERGEGNDHPTVKPLALMEWLAGKVVEGPVLDPFCGSGSTLLACKSKTIPCIGVDSDGHYCEIARSRVYGK